MMIKIWLNAFRIRTLTLSLSCIGMGSFLAADRQQFNGLIFTFCCLTSVLLQILSNLANDYGDSVNGADHAGRKSPQRAVQSGAISKPQMRRAIIVFIFLSLISGIILLWISFGPNWNGIVQFLVLGVFCIIAAIGYTVGKKPYGYVGLGDISVFLFFGIVGVMGSFYLFSHALTFVDCLPAATCGLFSVAVLNINNIRDIESDQSAGKYSIPVRIGKEKASIYHWALLLCGLGSSVVYTLLKYESAIQFLFLLSAPLLIKNATQVSTAPESQLDTCLKQMALITLLFVTLFGIGILLNRYYLL